MDHDQLVFEGLQVLHYMISSHHVHWDPGCLIVDYNYHKKRHYRNYSENKAITINSYITFTVKYNTTKKAFSSKKKPIQVQNIEKKNN